MGGFFSVTCSVEQFFQIFFSDLCARLGYIYKFDENLDDLTNDLEDLRAKRDDVSRKVVDKELKGRQRLTVVERWFSKVQIIETNTNLLIAEASALQERLPTHCSCCDNIISLYSCGKKIPKMLNEVKSLRSEGDFEEVDGPALPPVVEDYFSKQTFGLDAKLHSTWSLLMKSDIRMLGLYGMGGVGKTTLLNQINDQFTEMKDFDVVIRVKMPKDRDIAKIQDDIGKRLGLYEESWSKKKQTEKAGDIHKVLKHMKPQFVLLLDDLWKAVSLTDIGIPLLGKKYKIVFTTRFKDVCGLMEATEDIEVECLADEAAWDLFEKKARCGAGRFNKEIYYVAKRIAAKCGGLPLALEVIGKIMASKTNVDDWHRALSILESSPSEFRGTEEQLFQVLKLSYDYLEEKDAKLCFQYCALFSKAYNIKRDDLVDYWIGEGFIDEKDGRHTAKERGDEIISTLVEASLLMEDREGKQEVYMHDMIREMAFWIVVSDGDKFIVKTGAGLKELPKMKNWEAVTKMSLMNNEIESIPDSPRLPNPDRLKTLFLQNNKLVNIVGRLFQVLSTLVVLDLSLNPGITELPHEISLLVALRYLSLLKTRIKNLPDSLGDLKNLMHLDLEGTSNLQNISLISGLLKLQVLRFYRSASLDCLLLENLERLKELQFLTITVENNFEALKAFLGSNSARRTQGLYLKRLEVSGASEKSFAATFGELGSLSKLGMTECDIIETERGWEDNRMHHQRMHEIIECSPSTSSTQITPSNTWFKNLSAVVIYSCVALTDLTWLIYAANLKSLSVKISPKMEEVIDQKKAGNVEVEPFLKLQILDLGYLVELKSIYWTSLYFPSLQKIEITKCPKLRKLPLNSTSVKRIDDLLIEVDDGWKDGVEWESGAEERFRHVIRTVSVSQLHPV